VGDIYDNTTGAEAWKTILVSGLGKGGQGYFALDITDPANPKALWELKLGACYGGTPQNTDCHLGYSYGQPIITKLGGSGSDAGTWVVLVTSGLNNVPPYSPAGDGKGYLYVLNAANGQIMYRISTGVGSTTQPSGLKEINTYVTNGTIDNTVERVYGADMLGNVWRFDVNGTLADATADPAETSTSARDAVAIAKALDENGVAQPISSRPLIAEYNSRTLILIGTGRLIGVTDLTDTQTQSFYSFADTLANSTIYSNLRNQLKPLALTANGAGTERTVACAGTDAQCAATQGWYLDLPDPGERVNVNPLITRGTVAFTSNVPDSSTCSTGGYAWINFLDVLTGLAPSTSPGGIASNRLGNALNVGLGAIRIGNTMRFLARDSSGAGSGGVIPGSQPAPAGRRISWREITAR
jgi:type IV pilus assembly protein PilY1